VILWFTLFLTFMLGFVALGIDIAKLTATRTQLQNAADAAALAGASAVNAATGTIDHDLAISRAQFTGSQNKAFIDTPEPVIVDADDIDFPAADQVRVKVRRSGATSMVTHFAHVLGLPTLDVNATATAIAEVTRTVDCGLVPLGATPQPGETFHTGCHPGYVLKRGGGQGSNGNYGPLTFPACSSGPCAGTTGANAFRCRMEYDYCCPIAEGQQIDTEPGNMSGPIRQAIQARFASDTDQREDICYEDYTGNGRRVVFVPVTTDPGNGRAPVTVTGFGAFFIKNIPENGNDSVLTGEFIYAVIPGVGGGGGAGIVAYSLRLIH
jgi:Flp pilus assembly protein TadG